MLLIRFKRGIDWFFEVLQNDTVAFITGMKLLFKHTLSSIGMKQCLVITQQNVCDFFDSLRACVTTW